MIRGAALIRSAIIALVGSCAFACGSSPEAEPRSPVTQTTSASEAAAADQPDEGIPDQCILRKNACMPPIKWAEKLCGGVYPDLAIYMFRQGTPWTRYYLKAGLNAVNGWGPTVDEDMVQREEVLVINHRLTRDSLQVEGSLGTYDVLRWNGSCVTLDVSEVSQSASGDPRNSHIDFRALSDPMQDALMRDSRVASTHQARRKECKGASIGRVTKRCEDLDRELGKVVAEYVRETTDLPEPAQIP